MITASFLSCHKSTTLVSSYSTASGCGSPASGNSSRSARSAASCRVVIAMGQSLRSAV